MSTSWGGWKRFARPAALTVWALAGVFAWSVFVGAPGGASNVEAGVVFLVWMFLLSLPLGLPLFAVIDVLVTRTGWSPSGLAYASILWVAAMAVSYLQWFVILPRWVRSSRPREEGTQHVAALGLGAGEARPMSDEDRADAIEEWRRQFREYSKEFSERLAAEPALAAGIPRSFLPVYAEDLLQRLMTRAMEVDERFAPDQVAEVQQALTGPLQEVLEEELGPLLREDDEDSASIDDAMFARIRELENSPMLLTVNGAPVACPPTEDQVDESLRSLSGIPPSFVILSQSRMSYIQAGGSASSGFDLEYQVGMLEYHYRCTDESLDVATVARALKLYLHHDERWKAELDWERMEFGSGKG